MLKYLFYLLVFPGFLFASVFGLIVGWIERKVSARVQFRVGPPFFQNFYDVFKLWGKEIILIRSTPYFIFVIAPIIAFATVVMTSTIVGVAFFYRVGIGGDLIFIVYLMVIYSVALILGASSTGNVYCSIGAGREMKMLIADELAFILVIFVPIIRAGYKIDLTQILAYQSDNGMIVGTASGIIAFIVGILCLQAKMGMVPFDIAEAETEIVGGPLMEYSGPLLAFWKLAHYMMYVFLPMLLVILFCGGMSFASFGTIMAGIGKYLLIVVLMILIRNTNPRVRIDSAINFFWKWASPLALIAVILAIIGV
ncbi:MAG: NADH-quinone oxidoreductase subunit H [Candidatus Celaenobacter antarcticus]|nr:NADH-quinone oxidoreductase subunit H [Candidatus Celaenobacter antarcticus]